MANPFGNVDLLEDCYLRIIIKGNGHPISSSPAEAPPTDHSLDLFLALLALVYEQRYEELNWWLSQGARVLPSFLPPPDILLASEVLELAHPNHIAQGAFVMQGRGDIKEVKFMYGFRTNDFKEKRISEAVCGARYWKVVNNNFNAFQLEAESRR